MLARPLKNTLDYNGQSLLLDLSFNNILKVYELQNDEAFGYVEKLSLFVPMLVKNADALGGLTLQEQAQIVKRIFEEFITVKSRPQKNSKKSFDFIADAGYIYASFMSDYGIDLFDVQNKLDWRKFIWLFSGLSEESKMMRVISIRNRKIPKATKYNGEERRAIMEAKAYYALELSEAERERQFSESLKGFVKNFA